MLSSWMASLIKKKEDEKHIVYQKQKLYLINLDKYYEILPEWKSHSINVTIDSLACIIGHTNDDQIRK